jgi:hypothetical protein
VDRSGNLILNFHKKHLYESDKNWDCQEGKEFQVKNELIEHRNNKCKW